MCTFECVCECGCVCLQVLVYFWLCVCYSVHVSASVLCRKNIGCASVCSGVCVSVCVCMCQKRRKNTFWAEGATILCFSRN